MNSTQDTTEIEAFLGLRTGRLPAAVFIVMAIVFGLPGNCISLYIFLFRMEKKSTYVIFVSFLAMFDVLTCAVHMPLELIDLVFPFHIPEWLCKCFRFNNGVLFMGSLMTLLVIAVARYRHIVHPLKEKMSITTAKRCCGTVFVFSIFSAVPALVFNGNYAVSIGNSTATICYISDEALTTIFPALYLGFYWLVYCASVIILSMTYLVIGKTIRKAQIERLQMQHNICFTPSNTNVQPMTEAMKCQIEQRIHSIERKSTKNPNNSVKLKNRKTKVLFLITLLFILAYLPYVSIGVVLTLHRDFKENLSIHQEAIYRVAIRLPLINHVVNPVIYGFCDQAFKKHFKSLFHCSY